MTQTEQNRSKINHLQGLTMVAAFAAAMTLAIPSAGAQVDECTRFDNRLAATGKGDKDLDGLSNCREKRILGTNFRDFDTDDDNVSDGTEVENGTDPLDPDTDDDGATDGEEVEECTNGTDPDTDDDGTEDGEDDDPLDDLEQRIEGFAEVVVCPTESGEGMITVLGVDVLLTSVTEYDGVADCAELAALLGGDPSLAPHVEVEVDEEGDVLVATEVELDDEDADGEPDDMDDDDDGDGIDDDDEEEEDEDDDEDDDEDEDDGDDDDGDDDSEDDDTDSDPVA